MDFVHHCATMIQASFKGYIMRKRHQIAIKKLKKVTQSLLTCFRIWKAKRIYNCRRCYEVRMTYR
jgi:myosin heavy subunit